jgi:ubiquinone/menaquinone biosynthesis C-methylase UbiE
MNNIKKDKFKPIKWEDLYLNHSTVENDYFDLFFQPLKNKAMQFFLNNKQQENEILLEIGCGNGQMLKIFNDLGFVTVGIDINSKILETSLIEKNLICCDIHNLPFKSHSIYNIYSFSVLQYCDHDKVFSEIKRVLIPKGKLVLIENMGRNPFSSLYRLIHKKKGWAYPPFQTPDKYFNWNQQKKINELFSNVRFQSYHLTTPLVMFAYRIFPNTKIVHIILNILFNVSNIFDHVFLAVLPFLSKFCWRVIIFATNKE